MLSINLMPDLFADGVNKIAMERMTLDVAEELKVSQVRCNALRIDNGVLPKDWTPDPDKLDPEAARQIAAQRDYFEPYETGAAAMIWMLRQGERDTGTLESLRDMIVRKSVPAKAKKLAPLIEGLRYSW